MGGKVYQYIIRMKDEATAKLNQLARAAGLVDGRLSKSVETAKRASGAFSGLGGTFAKAAVSAGLLAAAFSFGQAVVDTTAKFQRYEAVLTNTLGSSSLAKQSLAELESFAASTPFQIDQLTDSYVKLANQGFTPTMGQMTKFGDLASSTGKGFDQLTEAFLDARVGEFERLKEFGIKARTEGDKITFAFKGQSTTVRNNGRAIGEYLLSLGSAKGVTGAMAAISATLGGKLSNLGDRFDMLKKKIGNMSGGVFDLLVGGANSLLSGMEKLLVWMDANKTMLSQLAVAATVLAGVYYTLVGAQRVAAWWTGASTAAFYAQYIATYGLSGAFTVLNAVMRANPIGFIITLLALLVTGIIWAWNNVDWFRNGLMGLWEVAKYVFGGIWEWINKYVLPPLMDIWMVFKEYILPVVESLWIAMKKVFNWVYDNRKLLLAPFAPIVELLDKFDAFKGVKAAFDIGYNGQGSAASVTNSEALGAGQDTVSKAAGTAPGSDAKGSKTLSDISNGGRRSNNITLNVSNKFDIRAGSTAEAAGKTAKTFAEELFRELNGAILAVNQ